MVSPRDVQDAPRLVELPTRPDAIVPFLETAHSRAYLLAPGVAVPDGTDAVLHLPDGARLAYAPRAPGGAEPTTLAVDPMMRGNSFKPLYQSDRALAAQLSIAASRRVDTGPESERVFLFLRGPGLLSLANEDVHRFGPMSLAIVPAGEPARLWAQGPEDALVVVFQPRGAAEPRRTLRGEIAKRRDAVP
jgi:hypothetical protein